MARYNLTFDLNLSADEIAEAVSAALEGDLEPARKAGAVIEQPIGCAAEGELSRSARDESNSQPKGEKL